MVLNLQLISQVKEFIPKEKKIMLSNPKLSLYMLTLFWNKSFFSCHLFLKLFYLYEFYNDTEKYLELISPAENNRFRLTSNLHGIEHFIREIYGTLISRDLSWHRKFVWKVSRFDLTRFIYLGVLINLKILRLAPLEAYL